LHIKTVSMPIYMDRHDVSETVTAENVAQLHQQDLKVEHEFGCRGLTYWFDEKRKTAFCLIEAPNEQAVLNMHNHAHGEVPHRIIEVDDSIVESFLGRIEDPVKAQNTKLNIINDPAFRTIMVAGFNKPFLKESSINKINDSLRNFINLCVETITKFNGSLVKHSDNCFLVSFVSVTKAVLCALELQSKYKNVIDKPRTANLEFNIGVGAGVPVTDKDGFFEDTIKFTKWMHGSVTGQIVLSQEVKELYESENLDVFINDEFIRVLSLSEVKFLTILMDYIERNWNNTDLKVDDFSKELGYSKSQLYRNMISLMNKSPNNFLKDYRLNKSLKLLKNHNENISEISFKTGFNSPAYFTKCFKKKYGLSPSDYFRES